MLAHTIFHLFTVCVRQVEQVLPSSLMQLPFTSCGVRHLTLSLILDSPKCEMSHLMKHPDWSEVTWNLVRRMPVTKVASLIWHIGTGRMRPTTCRRCNCEAGIDHIVFTCPTSAPQWRLFDRAIGAIIAPSFKLIFRGNDRRFQDLNIRPDTHIVNRLEMLHIHFVWCVWWAYQHNTDAPVERWPRRVVNLDHLLSRKARWLWDDSPLVSKIIRSWKY